jgi:hypothetical protein
MTGGTMGKYLVTILAVVIIASCNKGVLPEKTIQDDTIKALTEQLISGQEEEGRIKALNDLTAMGTQVRHNAMNKFVKAVENNPDLFPRENPDSNQSLIKEIITAHFNGTGNKKKKAYMKERKQHLAILNRLVGLSMQYKMYHEVAEMLYQKYLYGDLWYRESLDRFNNKAEAVEFEHARNAAIANLHLLFKIVSEERTKDFIGKCLEEIE